VIKTDLPSFGEDISRLEQARQRVQGVIERISFRSPAIPMQMRVNERGGLYLTVYMQVPHVDTGEVAFVQESHMLTPHFVLSVEEAVLVRIVSSYMRKLWLHEFDECLHLDETRVVDPHPDIPNRPAAKRFDVKLEIIRDERRF
jgi:hypothetical protein